MEISEKIQLIPERFFLINLLLDSNKPIENQLTFVNREEE